MAKSQQIVNIRPFLILFDTKLQNHNRLLILAHVFQTLPHEGVDIGKILSLGVQCQGPVEMIHGLLKAL